MLVLVIVAQAAGPLHAQACEIDQFSTAGTTDILAPDDQGNSADSSSDCCRCDTCTDGCVHVAFASLGYAGVEATFAAGTAPASAFRTGFAPTAYPVDLRPPIEG